jgi:glycosyltransferase involved in cell wall biosynthesis
MTSTVSLLPPELRHLRVALVHDYLFDYGGAERVLEALHELFPQAPVYVAFKDDAKLGIHAQNFKNWDIRESWLTKIPFYKKLFSPLRIFAANYFEAFDLSEFDLVISSSNAYLAKAVKVRPDAVHVCYCHTPPRALYGYSAMSDWQSQPVTRFFGQLINHYLRVVDYHIAQRVHYFIANSHETARRIKKFYRRDSTVIYPPVNVPVTAPKPRSKTQSTYFLYVNRLALAKHPEMAVQACTELNLPLKVAGSGKMLPALQAMAGPTVEFLGAVSDAELSQLYAGASALLYPVEDEDFGIVPIEAMSYGVPVIAHRSGGPRETIKAGETGLFFDDLTTQGLVKAIQKFQKQTFVPQKIRAYARQFSAATFAERMTEFLSTVTKKNISLT